MEYTGACYVYEVRIVILNKDYIGYNIYNIYSSEEINNQKRDTIFINFINKNHFNYLDIIIRKDEIKEDIVVNRDKMIKNNLTELEIIRKREYPVCIIWHSDIFNEMLAFCKYNILPRERFEKLLINFYISLDLKN